MDTPASSLNIIAIGFGRASPVLRFGGSSAEGTALGRALTKAVEALRAAAEEESSEAAATGTVGAARIVVTAADTEIPLAFDAVTEEAVAEASARVRNVLAAGQIRQYLHSRTQ